MERPDRLSFDDVAQDDEVTITWGHPTSLGGDYGEIHGYVRRTHEIGREIKITDDDGNKYTIYCDRSHPVVEKTTADGDFVGAIGRMKRMYDRDDYEEHYDY